MNKTKPKSPWVDFTQIKESVTMAQVLNHYGIREQFRASGSGQSIRGPCPIHGGDDRDVFSIDLSKNVWICHSSRCSSGGNVLDFVRLKEQITVRQAAILLSEWFNVPDSRTDSPPPSSSERPARRQKTQPLGDPPPVSSTEPAEESKPNNPLGFSLSHLDPAHPYLTERGLKSEIIAHFGLGFCEKGSMAGRIVVPIHNVAGELVAYAGRWPGEPPDKDTPKWRLPPGYRKAQDVFNLHRAVQEPPDAPLIIVEGFPGAEVVPQRDYLHQRWREAGSQMAVVELGLSDLCMVPLALPRSDIFVSMAAAMSNLAPDELAVFQVVFEPTRHAWAESILRAVTDNTGGPFFANRPDLVKQAREKIRSPLFAAVVRIAAFADDCERAHGLCLNMASCLRSFSQVGGNELIPISSDEYPAEAHEEDILRRQSRRTGMLLNAEELTGFVHLPTSAVVSEKLRRDTGRTRPAPAHMSEQADLLLGVNQHAGQEVPVWLRVDHRVRHTHIIGGSGYGKTTFLFNCIRQDIENGFGCGLLDPHGDIADRVLDFVPRDRLGDVVVVDPTDEDFSVGFNILAAHSDFEKDLIASDLVAVFRRQSSSWGEQMESVLHHAILAFLESSRGGTIADLKNFLLDAGTRNEFLKTVRDPDVVFYWKKGFPQLGGTRSIGPVVTRLEKLLSRKPVRRMVSQRVNKLDFADILDSGKIFIAKLPQGQIGAENAYLIGTLLVSKFQQMAMARQRIREEDRNPFFLYVDEAANFLTPSMAEILSGARKYRLGLTLSHQSLSQLKAEPLVAGALDSSACTRIVFRVGDQDARALAEGFSHFEARELQNLRIGEAICRVERSDLDFNLLTLPAMEHFEGVEYANRDEAIARSQAAYGTPIADLVPSEQEAVTDEPPPTSEEVTEAAEPQPQSPPGEVAAAPEESPSPPPEPPADTPPPAPRTYRPTEVRTDLEELGRGGEMHRAAQHELRALAESLGFRATIERQLPGSMETVDLHLQRDDFQIGCEISVTNTLDYEVRNVLKLLRVGIPSIAMIALDAEKLSRLESAIRNSLSPEENSRVSCFLKDDFIQHLQSLVLASPQREEEEASPKKTKQVKGWKVKRTVVELSAAEQKEREAEIAAAIAENIRRKVAEKKKSGPTE